jgi:hypothetical protein
MATDIRVQPVIKLDAHMIAQIGKIGKLLSPVGPQMNIIDTVRACLNFTERALPHFMPLTFRLSAELGISEPLGLAIDRIVSFGINAAHKQTDVDVASAKKKCGTGRSSAT